MMDAGFGLFLGLLVGSVVSVLAIHAARGWITLAPALAAGGIAAFVCWQIAQVGWWVDWSVFTLNVAYVALTPTILVGAAVIYAMDGLQAAKAYCLVVLGGVALGIGFLELLDALADVTPLPSLFFLPLTNQLIAGFGILSGCVGAIVMFEVARRRLPPALALPTGVLCGLFLFLAAYTFLTYGLTLGVRSLQLELPGYLLAGGVASVACGLYGALATRRAMVMPARPINSLLAFWQRAEAHARQAEQSVIEARRTIRELRDLNHALAMERDIRQLQFERSSLAILEVDGRGRLKAFNPAADRLFGLSGGEHGEFAKERTIETILPDLPGMITESRGSATLSRRDALGNKSAVDVTIMPLWEATDRNGFTVIAEDVTERERQRLREKAADRMQGLSLASRMVAHDFSNMLLAIESNLRVLTQSLKGSGNDRVIDATRAIGDATRRGREMLIDFDNVGIVRDPDLHPRRLAELVAEAIRLNASDATSAGISLFATGDRDCIANVDATQMLRVFANLIQNALRAVGAGGSIELRTEQIDDGVSVTVVDSGVGMTAEQLKKAFEPGFSTKASGRGGLGLVISRFIVEAHGGSVTIRSDPGRGTVVSVRLPRVPAAGPQVEPALENLSTLVFLTDPAYRRRIIDFLSGNGSNAAEILDVQELAAVVSEEPGAYQLLVVDGPLVDHVRDSGLLGDIAVIAVQTNGEIKPTLGSRHFDGSNAEMLSSIAAQLPVVR